jgi:hypothetical protein
MCRHCGCGCAAGSRSHRAAAGWRAFSVHRGVHAGEPGVVVGSLGGDSGSEIATADDPNIGGNTCSPLTAGARRRSARQRTRRSRHAIPCPRSCQRRKCRTPLTALHPRSRCSRASAERAPSAPADRQARTAPQRAPPSAAQLNANTSHSRERDEPSAAYSALPTPMPASATPRRTPRALASRRRRALRAGQIQGAIHQSNPPGQGTTVV